MKNIPNIIRGTEKRLPTGMLAISDGYGGWNLYGKDGAYAGYTRKRLPKGSVTTYKPPRRIGKFKV